MILLKKLKINTHSSINILIPDLKDKFNYYYEPTEQLHVFDEVTVLLKEENREVILFKDICREAIAKLKGDLKIALNNELLLPDFIKIGEVGLHYNIDSYNEKPESIDYSYFWLWSTRGTQTWLYNQNNKIYLEIIPSYPWIFVEPKESDDYITFDEFMKTYQPIAVEEIDHATAQKWLEQCNEILEKMIKV